MKMDEKGRRISSASIRPPKITCNDQRFHRNMLLFPNINRRLCLKIELQIFEFIKKKISLKRWSFEANSSSRKRAARNSKKIQINNNNAMLSWCLVCIILFMLEITLAQALVNTPSILTDRNRGGGGAIIRDLALRAPTNNAADDSTLHVAYAPAALAKVLQSPLTTKRSISEQNISHSSFLTTMAPPLLTTLRYTEKLPHHQQKINTHHRNYEFDLERDHALPTSAPNADILKSNSNPSYPNPNRHHPNHDRDRQRHVLNITPAIADLATYLRKNLNGQPLNNNDMPSYSPPARAFFTPPLPPEYQNPFADKPTLRGTNSEAIVSTSAGGSSATHINRRPIPPPSLMPGHERIPLRPPDTLNNLNTNESSSILNTGGGGAGGPIKNMNIRHPHDTAKAAAAADDDVGGQNQNQETDSYVKSDKQKEILPNIRRILSGSNGNKGEIPEVFLKQVTQPTTLIAHHHQPPSAPVVLLNNNSSFDASINMTSNINQQKANTFDKELKQSGGGGGVETKNELLSLSSDPSLLITNNKEDGGGGGGSTIVAASSAATTTSGSTIPAGSLDRELKLVTNPSNNNNNTFHIPHSPPSSNAGGDTFSTSTSSSAAAASNDSTWTIAWHIHVYLSVILFTILAVYSFYKILTYNKLTHLFPQSYFLCIHIVLITIATTRIFYLCYDAYNINSSFHLFISEILLNLPANLLTISFSVLMLFLFRKSLNHKHNRYSAIIRPLTVIVGCGVHVILCITLHYVESYTMHNYYQQQLQIQQQQQQHQQFLYQQQLQRQQRQQTNHQNHQHHHQQQLERLYNSANLISVVPPSDGQQQSSQMMTHHQASMGSWQNIAGAAAAAGAGATIFPFSTTTTTTGYLPPPRVLSLICQIIYIFVCLSMGLLYLYLYRILKRILQSKSQNYIHGYKNLSYAIHITIATALLFVLLAILQIFGAIGISSKRSLTMPQTTSAAAAAAAVVEVDWLQWGYQFSLRLIEVSIITLISWVTGLKTKLNSSIPSSSVVGNIALSNGGGSNINGGGGSSSRRKMTSANRNHHTGFFLPCTSTSSQEHFEPDDYPAVCSANTNLHTYTMRTGKLIYDDSYALNSLSQPTTTTSATAAANNFERPYETNSLRSSSGGNKNNGFQQRFPQHHHHYHHHQYATTDYLTDATTDHYENPNFDLQSSNMNIKFNSKAATTSSGNSITTASSSKSGGGFSCAASRSSSQQQMLLLKSGGEGCYSEPNYDFNNFERPKFGCGGGHIPPPPPPHQQHLQIMATMDNNTNMDRPDSNSCASSGSSANFTTFALGERRSGTGKRYTSYNSIEPANHHHRHAYNAMRKSGTLNNIGNGRKLKGTQQQQQQIQNYHAEEEVCHPRELLVSDDIKEDFLFSCERRKALDCSSNTSRTPLKFHREFLGSDLENDECAYASSDIAFVEKCAAGTQPIAIE